MSVPHSPQPGPSVESNSGAHYGWDKVVYAFLLRVGFTQAAVGFTSDLLVMNPKWEQTIIPDALLELTKGILACGSGASQAHIPESLSTIGLKIPGPSLDQRKLDYIHLANGIPPRSQSNVCVSLLQYHTYVLMLSQINKEISLFLARNRARNDVSNRSEFVYTPAEKRRRLTGSEDDISPSCARTDAKSLDRDVQMKYDIAKNEDGPLSRTIPEKEKRDNKQKGKMKDDGLGSVSANGEEEWTAIKRPGLDERLRNVEAHLAVHYVPSAPRTLLARLRYLEEHLIQLERDYPPWAALHFNQPNRGWPPPPRQTPIIVPPHLRPKDAPAPTPAVHELDGTLGNRRLKNTGSSLHRAVMERLEVKQAMTDMA
ncbi:hypothetical protein H0H87_004077 [Tephrocybe sp. NHM501043]|nr:hypothetical protein H0H87_004077 [Tephrocybe sp. NHM501043]